MNRKIQKKLTWLLLFSVINWVFYPSEAYASRSDQGSNTHSFSVADNQYKYSSYYLDSESGMYYLKARYYSSELMRFISRDTYDLSNKYAYCDGNPITQTDPDGHSPVFPFILLGAVNLAGTVAAACELGEGIKKGDLETVIPSGFVLAAALASSFACVKGLKKMEAQREMMKMVNFKELDIIKAYGEEAVELFKKDKNSCSQAAMCLIANKKQKKIYNEIFSKEPKHIRIDQKTSWPTMHPDYSYTLARKEFNMQGYGDYKKTVGQYIKKIQPLAPEMSVILTIVSPDGETGHMLAYVPGIGWSAAGEEEGRHYLLTESIKETYDSYSNWLLDEIWIDK